MTPRLYRVIQRVNDIEAAVRYCVTPDLDPTLARVREAGGRIDAPIEDMPWGERLFYAADPFGNPISFVHERTLIVRGAGTSGAAAP
jgi:predicted enzyme related to lactoylglutathione lyase